MGLRIFSVRNYTFQLQLGNKKPCDLITVFITKFYPMRLLVFLGFLLAIDWYAFQAFRVLSQGWSSSARLVLAIVYWSVPVLALVLLLLAAYTNVPHSAKAFYMILRTLVFIAYLSKVMILPVLLIDDLRRLVAWISDRVSHSTPSLDNGRSRFLAQMGILLGSIPFATLTYGIIRNPYRYKVFRETIKLKDLPSELEGLRIVQISDIHSGSFTFKEPVKHAIDLINAEQPDLVFFTGDLVNDRAEEMLPYLDVFDKIRARYGVFSVLGNHDYGDYVAWENIESKRANLEQLKKIHQQLGWQLLLNEHKILSIREQSVAIIGVENHSALARFPRRGDLARAMNGTENTVLKLLLSHDPTHWDLEVNALFRDIAITFSGHTHGFQFGVEIPGFRWSPAQFLYKQWAGLYQKGQQYLYVNRGLGFLGYPGRVGILPEVALIELRRS